MIGVSSLDANEDECMAALDDIMVEELADENLDAVVAPSDVSHCGRHESNANVNAKSMQDRYAPL